MSKDRAYLKMDSDVSKVVNVLELSQVVSGKKVTVKDYEDVLKTFEIARTKDFDEKVKETGKKLDFL